MKRKYLNFALAMSMLLPASSLPVFAQETPDEQFSEENKGTFDFEVADKKDSKAGQDVYCNLTLDTLVNGNPASKITYDSANKDDYMVQVGGRLDMENVQKKFIDFKRTYFLTDKSQGRVREYLSKDIAGQFKFHFEVNPKYVQAQKGTDGSPLIENKQLWQEAFEKGSEINGNNADIFFSFMKCTSATYSEENGTVDVIFMTNPTENNGVLQPGNVKVSTIDTKQAADPTHPIMDKEQDITGLPDFIEANSPEGSLNITQAAMASIPVNTTVKAVTGDKTEFRGDIDMTTHLVAWLKNMFFPVRFDSTPVEHADLDLIGKNQTGGSTGGNGSGTTAPAKTVALYRLYNPNSGEHFYTQALVEKDHLASIGWDYEGIGWYSPTSSNIPVYRLYNPNAGDHHYTKIKNEKDELVKVGWKYEGIGFYSLPDNQGVKVYREYNPNAKMAGAHNYTTNKVENDYLISIGWLDEGIGWWASAAGKPAK